jgi:hypothetical protein
MARDGITLNGEQIAAIEHKLLVYFMLAHGVNLSANLQREIGNVAKKIDVPLDMLTHVVEPLLQEMIKQSFEKTLSEAEMKRQ